MKTYRIVVDRHTNKGTQILLRIDMQRDHFQRKDFAIVLDAMFELAAEGIENKTLTATVQCNGQKIFTVRGLTEVDGSTIYVNMDIARPREKFRRVRCMNIAS